MEISTLLARILEKRGITSDEERERFLNPRYEDTHDPYLLEDMELAVERIMQALKHDELIYIYGDYDIDGLSATSLLLDAIGAMGGKVEAYIPDRFEEGYGINTDALKTIKKAGASLVITVDCGSTSHEPLQWAQDNQLDVVVTDHHTVKETLPPAVAIINPKRADNKYPFIDLAGVGVAFKLVQALQMKGLLPEGREKWLLDLVALGTVCDVVSLTGENRILVTYGLKVFAKTPRYGMQALMKVAGVNKAEIDTHHFGFALGPRLNAAGRIEHARYALDLFLSRDRDEAEELADKLDKLNLQRRAEQDRITEMALAQAEEYRDDPVLVLSHPTWSHGIVGIVAAKIMERFYKPTIVMQELGEETKGSARSLGGFSIVEAMKSSDRLLIKYGGHHVAAGCSLKTENIDAFRQSLNDYFFAQGFGDLKPEFHEDIALEDLSLLSQETYEAIADLAPFGMGNPKPLFMMSGVDIGNARTIGKDNQHIKLTLRDEIGGRLDGVGFNLASSLEEASQGAVWFELDENEYMGRTSLQAMIKGVA